MTNLDQLINDKERIKAALSNLRAFVEDNHIDIWWCKNKCPVNYICDYYTSEEDGQCAFEYGPNIENLIADWCESECND